MKYLIIFVTVLLLVSCNAKGPEPVKLNVDACVYCKMPISDPRYAAELITKKGRLHKFDDADCIIKYTRENGKSDAAVFYFSNFAAPGQFVRASDASFIKGGSLKSPMAGNTAAFSSKQEAEKFANETGAQMLTWEQVMK